MRKDNDELLSGEVRSNFIKITLSQTQSKVADELSSAKTVLPWLLDSLGASSFWIGLLVPVREAMSMLPQIFLAGIVHQKPLSKKVWLTGALLQGFFLGLLGLVTLFLGGEMAGPLVVLLLFLFSISRGLCSIASKDVLGKTIPKTRRGRLNGITASVSGILTIVIGLLLIPLSERQEDIYIFSTLIFMAVLLWLIAGLTYNSITEKPGAVKSEVNSLRGAVDRLKLLSSDKVLRRFIFVRALLITSALSAPYYVLMIREYGTGVEFLGSLVLVTGFASSVSSYFWGRFSDTSSKKVMLAGGFITLVLGILVFLAENGEIINESNLWILITAYFVLTIAHRGVRIGRKTYVVDLAGGIKRTEYVAVSNTIIGIVLLLSGSIGALSTILSHSEIVLLMALISGAGIIAGFRLPEVEQKESIK